MAEPVKGDTALGPYRVLDLTDKKGHFCAKLLGDLGADVVKIEAPGGDPARCLGPFYHDNPRPEKSLYWFALNTSKRSITLDLETRDGREVFKRLVRTAHFVIESYPPGYLDSLGLGYEELRQLNLSIIVASITPFGQSGPYSHYRASDITTQAMGGLMYLCGDPDRPPLKVGGGPQGYVQAAAQAAVGALIAHYSRCATGEGQHVDVSMQESLLMANDTAQVFWDLGQTITRRTGAVRPFGAKRMRIVYPCKDGFIGIVGLVRQCYEPLVQWLAEKGMADDLVDPEWHNRSIFPGEGELAQAEVDHVEGIAAAFFKTCTKAELYEEAQRRRIIVCPVSSPRDLLESPQLKARDYWTSVHHPELGGSIIYPGAPFKMSVTPWRIRRRPPLIGEHTQEILAELGYGQEQIAALMSRGASGPGGRAPSAEPQSQQVRGCWQPRQRGPTPQALTGLRVADFSWVGVGPLTAKYLADHGATVIRIESTTHPDGLRNTPPFKDNIAGVNRSGYYANFNSSKLGATLNLNNPKGVQVAKRIVQWADVVMESYTPKAMRKWGLTYQDLVKVRPDLIMISAPMLGQTGPHAMFMGVGNVIQGLAGVTHLTGWPDRDPVGTGVAYTDFWVPHLAATAVLAALDYRRRTGRGQYIDLSQLEAAIHCLGPAILDFTCNSHEQHGTGNRVPNAAPHGAYRCRGEDRWVAIAVLNDEEWQRFRRAIGNPAWSQDSCFATLSGRKQHEDELDRLVEAWTVNQAAEEVMHTLQSAGVAAGVVQNARDLFADPQLAYREHFRWLEHAEMGSCSYDAPSFRLSRTPCQLSRAAPVLGQHNEYFYRDILGMSEEEFVACLVEGAFE